ncbi:MAG TPA: HAD-IA family hydrolase [Candidatus Dormibacteraeota bacterium]|nr:HAD-IA family hydrolase [Candidatus Dormibacteraeota bacterium]
MPAAVAVAVAFDVDGTLVDTERDGHRVAFNRAFSELGVDRTWDVEHYGRLLAIPGGRRRLDHDLAAAGLPETERADLVVRLHERKTELFVEMAESGLLTPRSGVTALIDGLRAAGARLGVATTGSGAWVHQLLDRLFPDRFDEIVTSDEAPRLKPHPQAYTVVLQRLGVAPDACVAIEDSAAGLRAACGAGLRCAVVVNGYTRDQALQAADLVVDGFEPTAAVLADPHGLHPRRGLDVETVLRLLPARGSA